MALEDIRELLLNRWHVQVLLRRGPLHVVSRKRVSVACQMSDVRREDSQLVMCAPRAVSTCKVGTTRSALARTFVQGPCIFTYMETQSCKEDNGGRHPCEALDESSAKRGGLRAVARDGRRDGSATDVDDENGQEYTKGRDVGGRQGRGEPTLQDVVEQGQRGCSGYRPITRNVSAHATRQHSRRFIEECTCTHEDAEILVGSGVLPQR